MDTDEPTMGDILKRALENNGSSPPTRKVVTVNPFVPVKGTVELSTKLPLQGTEAYKNIMSYSQAFIQYLENLGEAAVAEAEQFRERCRELAQRISIEAEEEANRATTYISRIQDMAKTLDKVAHGDKD